MDLAGQCLKQSVKASWDRLAPVLQRLRDEPAHERETPRPRQARRPGQVLKLVVAIVIEADSPMRGCEVCNEVAARLGESVSWSTVRNALVRGCAQDDLERVGYGRYAGKQ